MTNPAVRQAYGTLCGLLGIGLNIILFVLKFLAGTISGAISITADAFNNLSDAGSSVVTLLGFRLAAQKPDKEHPFGHGRFEYISGLIVSLAVLLMGFELGKSSVEKIIHPEDVTFSWLAVGILAASILVKVYMAIYNKGVGRKISSPSMQATATDSLSDTISTSVVLATTVFSYFFPTVHIDAYCGLAVSCLILYAGVKAAKETITPLLGTPPTPEFVKEIENLVMANPEIKGIHDLVVHDYGPGRLMISLHAEVSCKCDLIEIHDVIDGIEQMLRSKLGCEATIHMDPIESDDELTTQTRAKVASLMKTIHPDITIHDFRMVSGPTHTNVIFDAVVPYTMKETGSELITLIENKVEEMEGGNYFAVVKIDRSYASK